MCFRLPERTCRTRVSRRIFAFSVWDAYEALQAVEQDVLTLRCGVSNQLIMDGHHRALFQHSDQKHKAFAGGDEGQGTEVEEMEDDTLLLLQNGVKVR